MESGPVHGVQKASHCGWQIHYHVVFPVKYRKALLDEEVVQIITETAQAISERYDMEFERIGCDGDHIHLLCTAHPKIAPGQIVRVFKSITAREIFRRKPGIKKSLWGGASSGRTAISSRRLAKEGTGRSSKDTFGTRVSLVRIYGSSSFSSTTWNTPRSWRGVVYSTATLIITIIREETIRVDPLYRANSRPAAPPNDPPPR